MKCAWCDAFGVLVTYLTVKEAVLNDRKIHSPSILDVCQSLYHKTLSKLMEKLEVRMKEMTDAYKNCIGKSKDFEEIRADGRTAVTRMLQKQCACGNVSEYDTSVSSCERGNELSGSTKG